MHMGFLYWLVEFSRNKLMSKSSPWSQGRKRSSGRKKAYKVALLSKQKSK